jgi:hypothetical protein
MSHKNAWKVADLDWRIIEDCEGNVVADIRSSNPDDSYLIAAAHDLLDALEEIVGLVHLTNIHRDELDNAYAAIKKAKQCG